MGAYSGKFDIRRIANDDIEAAAIEDAVELDEPVEGLMGLHPLGVGNFVTHFHAVVTREVTVEFVFQRLEPFLEFLLVGGRHCAVAFGLELAEFGEGIFHVGATC